MELYELTVHELLEKLDKNEITSEDVWINDEILLVISSFWSSAKTI